MSPRRLEMSLEGVIQEAIRSNALETHVCLPGVVEAFNPVTVRASVRIPLKRLHQDLNGERLEDDWPLLTDVPVAFPHAAAGFAITMPITIGDEVLLVFLDRDPSRWLTQSVEQRPETLRSHDLSDGIILAGFNTNASQILNYNPTALEIRAPGTTNRIRIEADGGIDIQGSDLKIGDGTDDLLGLLEDTIQAVHDAVTTGPFVMDGATKGALVTLKARVTTMKG